MTDIERLINFIDPKAKKEVRRWGDKGEDFYEGADGSPQAMQTFLDSHVVWSDDVTPMTGQQVFDAIQAFDNSEAKNSAKLVSNSPLLKQIYELEQSVTTRMLQEAVARVTDIDPRTGRTAAQQVAWVREQCKLLRAQLL